MKLLGWHNPLPPYLEEAVHDGRLKVTEQKSSQGPYEILEGEVVHKGITIAFVGNNMTLSRVPATQHIFMLPEIAKLRTY